MQINRNEVYTLKEVMKLLKISESSVRRHIKSGYIPSTIVGGQYRILGSDLIKTLRKNKKSEAKGEK